MNHSFPALAFQADDSSMWIIIIAVVVFLFFLVVIIGIGLAVFFVMRKKNKAKAAATLAPLADGSGAVLAPGDNADAVYGEAAYGDAAYAGVPEVAVALDEPPPAIEQPLEEIRSDVADAFPAPAADSGDLEFDPSRTVAINRESTVAISYGEIRFVSGVLANQEFEVKPEGAYIGREASLSQIVVSDPRISKRHLWIGVKDGLVKIVDQDSRNGTFLNDPKSDRITEATLTSGDTVILGESDVARFEYLA
jgi:FHA domain